MCWPIPAQNKCAGLFQHNINVQVNSTTIKIHFCVGFYNFRQNIVAQIRDISILNKQGGHWGDSGFVCAKLVPKGRLVLVVYSTLVFTIIWS